MNTQTVGRQGFPDVAAAPNGDFVVVWSRTFLVQAVYGQRYDAAGAPRGSEFTVTPTNGPSGNWAAGRVAVAPNGRIRGRLGHRRGSDRAAFAAFRLFGRSPGAEFRVDVSGEALSPSIDMDGSGNAVVAWYRLGPTPGDPDSYAILARRLSAAGVPLGGEILATSHQYWPAVASDPQGNFVVAWQSVSQDGSGDGVIGQRFDSSGARAGGEFLVNTFTTSAQVAPKVDMSDTGDFTVAWSSFLQDGSCLGAFAQRFESSGARRSSEFQVNTFTLSSQYVGGIAADAAGNFTVAYQDDIHDGNDSGVFA